MGVWKRSPEGLELEEDPERWVGAKTWGAGRRPRKRRRRKEDGQAAWGAQQHVAPGRAEVPERPKPVSVLGALHCVFTKSISATSPRFRESWTAHVAVRGWWV